MTSIALSDRDFEPMSSEGDATVWTGLVAAISAFGGLLAGFYFRSRDRAALEGKSAGEVAAWRLDVDRRLTMLSIEIKESEARNAARLAIHDARKDALDERISEVPTRVEMQAGLDRMETRIGAQISALSTQMHNEVRVPVRTV